MPSISAPRPISAARSSRAVRRRAKLFGSASVLFYDKPLEFVRGEGCWLYDADGVAYLDAYNNVPSVGHCHPTVVEAAARQLGRLNIHNRYLHPGILDYAERLLATLPRLCPMSPSPAPAVRATISRCGWRPGFTGARWRHRHRGGLPRQYGAGDGVSAELVSSSRAIRRACARSRRLIPIARRVELSEQFADARGTRRSPIWRARRSVLGAAGRQHFLERRRICRSGRFPARRHRCVHRAGGLLIADEVQAASAAPARRCGDFSATAS